MRNEIKILIAAIVVIIIVLVGAYALSGSQNAAPTVTPTAVPVTATPTPTPVPANGGSSGGAASPTPTASVAPTAVPTPTPMPASGVKQTEFGYWITYPPLDPEKWSTNPPPVVNPGNIVYFDPTSQTVTVPIMEPAALVQEPQAQAIVHRDGNLSGTTNVLISRVESDNMFYGDDYTGGYWIPDGGINANLTDNHNGTFTLRFDPGVSEQTIYIYIWNIREGSIIDSTAMEALFNGYARLTIVGADSPFTYGDRNQYTINVNSPSSSGQVMQFISNGGYITNDTYFDTTSMDVSEIEHGTWEVNITLTRSSTSGSLSPHVEMNTNIPGEYLYINQQPTFDDGQSTATLQVIYSIDTSIEGPYAEFTIDSSPLYSIGSNNPFYLDLYLEW